MTLGTTGGLKQVINNQNVDDEIRTNAVQISADNGEGHTLLPLEIRTFPDGDRYVVSSQPLASSPSSRKGTG